MLHLPLLNALKTFVVAGHHLNFTKASEELLVSPSAVSHQIRVLEDYLDTKLFIRENRALSLTAEGASLHAALQGPFDQISRALQQTLQSKHQQALKIALRPFFSSTWLAQKLTSFWGDHPQIHVDLIHTIAVPDFHTENIDLGIVWGKGGWPEMESRFLLAGELTPICSRKLLQEKGGVNSPKDLEKFTLIHDEDHSAWDSWLKKADIADSFQEDNSLIIDDTNVRVQAVANGQGVMLGCPTLLRPQLKEGSLVRLFEISLDSYSYYLVYPNKIQPTKSMQTFIDWIVKETQNNNPST